MKLGKVTRNDPLVRSALSIHSSVSDDLKRYQQYYKSTIGDDISMSQLVEEIVKRFMREDRNFQKFQSQSEPSASASPSKKS